MPSLRRRSGVRLLPLRAADKEPNSLGKRVADFSLRDTHGHDVRFSSFKDKKAIVVVLTGTKCTINNPYMPASPSSTKPTPSVACSSCRSTPTDRTRPACRRARQAERDPVPRPQGRGQPCRRPVRRSGRRRRSSWMPAASSATTAGSTISSASIYREPPTRRQDLAEALWTKCWPARACAEPATLVSGCFIAPPGPESTPAEARRYLHQATSPASCRRTARNVIAPARSAPCRC